MTLFRCTFRVSPEVLDALSGCLFEAGAQGLEESGVDTLSAYVESEEEAALLITAYRDFCARVRVILPDAELEEPEVEELSPAWQDAWLAALEPVAITERVVLRPTTRGPAPDGEDTLWFEPNPSFGDGGHPTTQLAARAVERWALDHPGRAVFDVGSGNGVLALLAVKSGASRAFGVDVSTAAIDGSRRNAELNGLASQTAFVEGTVNAATERFPLVVANINTPVLEEIAGALVARVAPGGTLLLTGLLEEDRAALLPLYERAGARLVAEDESRGWSLLELQVG